MPVTDQYMLLLTCPQAWLPALALKADQGLVPVARNMGAGPHMVFGRGKETSPPACLCPVTAVRRLFLGQVGRSLLTLWRHLGNELVPFPELSASFLSNGLMPTFPVSAPRSGVKRFWRGSACTQRTAPALRPPGPTSAVAAVSIHLIS